MQENSPVLHMKLFLAVFLLTCLILMVFYYDDSILTHGFTYRDDEIDYFEAIKTDTSNRSTRTTKFTTHAPIPTAVSTSSLLRSKPQNEESDFLVYSSKCKIVNLNPFNNDAKKYFHPGKYKACRTLEHLTYVTKIDNTATLHINNDVSPSYTTEGISCCYANVTRKFNENHPDSAITISSCKTFENNVTIYNDPVMVKCTDLNNTSRKLYENVHIATLMKDDIKQKLNSIDNNTHLLSVLFVGIDSISRLNFIRAMPKTFDFVEQNGWIPLKGYNKMDDNTFPNLMAILTGYNQSQAYKICNPKAKGMLDKCDMLWYDYRRLGYVTGYGEDEGSINTFNYAKEGFVQPPTDYYFRPYVLATEQLRKIRKDSMTYCTGPETAGERIMNLAKDFAVTFKGVPNFGFFWMNSFSHNELNSPTGMDGTVKTFLEDLSTAGITEKSIVIFLSDHGMRFGDIRLTDTGWLEERLPFIYVSFPKWFQTNFTKEFENFKNNSFKLTTPFDIYMTLQHILVLSGSNYSVRPSLGCPKCRSLFGEIESERSCEDAGIAQHWCTCSGYKKTSLDPAVSNKIAEYFLDNIHNIIRSRNSDRRCAKYSLDKIIGASVSQRSSDRNETYLLVKLKTHPKAIFETTLSYVGDINNSSFSLSGGVSRLDSYDGHSKCVNDAYLRTLCYCRSTGERV